MTDTGVINAVHNLPELKSLNLTLCEQISDESLIAISQRATQIENLWFSDCTKVGDRGVLEIAKLKHLRLLDVESCQGTVKLRSSSLYISN